MTALIIVDVQKDFCPGGSLACPRGHEVAGFIEEYLDKERELKNVQAKYAYEYIIASRDYHDPSSDNGGHFSETPDFVDTWPAHCVQGTEGADYALNFPGELEIYHVTKGMGRPAYSVLEGYDAEYGVPVTENVWSGQDVHVCGIATDYCVKATVLDLLELGASVTVLAGLCAPVTEETGELALAAMRDAGAKII